MMRMPSSCSWESGFRRDTAMKTLITIALLAVAAIVLAMGCHCSSPDKSEQASSSNDVKHLMAQPSAKGGSELWGENCTRCHNARPPDYYSDGQWDAIVHHMRLRANLTGEESRKIAEFLKAAN